MKRVGYLSLRQGDGGFVGVTTDYRGVLLIEIRPHEFEVRELPDPPAAKGRTSVKLAGHMKPRHRNRSESR